MKLDPKFLNWSFKKPQRYLGPSQFATVLGLNRFKDINIMKKEMERGFYQQVNTYMHFGEKWEQAALYCYRKVTGEEVIRAKFKELSSNNRIGGIADGLLIVRNHIVVGGVEIKCHFGTAHPLTWVPKYYLPQIAGYMAIYQVKFWDFMSCCVNQKGVIRDYRIIRVQWDELRDIWQNEWYPKIQSFIDSLEWYPDPDEMKDELEESSELSTEWASEFSHTRKGTDSLESIGTHRSIESIPRMPHTMISEMSNWEEDIEENRDEDSISFEQIRTEKPIKALIEDIRSHDSDSVESDLGFNEDLDAVLDEKPQPIKKIETKLYFHSELLSHSSNIDLPSDNSGTVSDDESDWDNEKEKPSDFLDDN